ncbi:MAG: rod-binding protein [Roseibium sp.]|uniref:rod-binding protein n=1 Tax=Roseibium sp. TaxID=1936156 RepID=UPI001B2D510E|nr:rod-binding protein [Roseibium sp.]MBO6508738.1 rod-binding protein [Roseibium sp.]MBO6893291.1 rod-binding protein [Roseibium sp.]MBO6932200.1 rod-binding protein [Roseibium sp.]
MLSPIAPPSPQPSPLDTIRGVDVTDRTATREAAEEFEAVFLNTMLQQMFTGLENGGTWGKGHGADAWQSLLIDEYARSISAAGGIGLADSVERELIRLQEGS